MSHFNNGAQVLFSIFRDISIAQSKKYIIVLGLTHAVTIEYKSVENIMYRIHKLIQGNLALFIA
jgi:hypothetical protein